MGPGYWLCKFSYAVFDASGLLNTSLSLSLDIFFIYISNVNHFPGFLSKNPPIPSTLPLLTNPPTPRFLAQALPYTGT